MNKKIYLGFLIIFCILDTFNMLIVTNCVLKWSDTQIHGVLSLKQKDGNAPIELSGCITGLPNGKHGLHVHEFGDMTDGCTSTDTHFNLYGKVHGAPSDSERHTGDLGNVSSNNGTCHVNIRDSLISLEGPTSIIGRSIVVHQLADDLGRGAQELSKTTGNSGARLACCIIGIAKTLAIKMP